LSMSGHPWSSSTMLNDKGMWWGQRYKTYLAQKWVIKINIPVYKISVKLGWKTSFIGLFLRPNIYIFAYKYLTWQMVNA
jgi:hypothetical protein